MQMVTEVSNLSCFMNEECMTQGLETLIGFGWYWRGVFGGVRYRISALAADSKYCNAVTLCASHHCTINTSVTSVPHWSHFDMPQLLYMGQTPTHPIKLS